MQHTAALLLITLCAFSVGGPALAQPEQAMATIRPHAIRAHMGFLADDLLEGRRTATRGYDLAARYVAAQFEALGLEPAGTGGSYFQPVSLVQMTTVEPECYLALFRDGRKTELRYGVDYHTGSIAQDSDVTAPLVFAGYSVTAPEVGYDDYAGIDVRGKIVVLLTGAPPSFPHNQRAYYSDPLVKIKNAVARGAVGFLVIFTQEMERMISWERVLQQARQP